MKKISTVIITYNEERDIERCLLSLKNISDEIIVVDSFSKDRTKEICTGHDTRFFEREFLGYSDQKNFGNTQAKHLYILSIDADEVLSPDLEKSILEFKKNKNSLEAYSFNRLTNYCGKWIKHCGWYPDAKLRLWKKSLGGWEGEIHEEVKLDTETKIGHLNGDLFHYSYHSIAQHVNQANKFTDYTAAEAHRRGKKASLFKIMFNPIWKFKRDYIFKGGFMDGYYGFIVCAISAFATFLKYTKLRQISKK